MLTDAARKAVDEAVGLVAKDGYTFCGFAVLQNEDGTAHIQPFSNHYTVAEFIHNLLAGAGLIMQGTWDTAAVEAAIDNFQKQSITVHEA